jgi:hypothetical protein
MTVCNNRPHYYLIVDVVILIVQSLVSYDPNDVYNWLARPLVNANDLHGQVLHA